MQPLNPLFTMLFLVFSIPVLAQDSLQTTATLRAKPMDKSMLQELLRTPGLKVFIIAPDAAAVTHATNALHYITDWKMVDDKSQAQVMLRFSLAEIGMGDKKGKAQFLDPATELIWYETKSVNTSFSLDFNTKRGVIDKIVNKEIKKLIKADSNKPTP